MAGRMFLDGAFRRHLSHQLALQAFEHSLVRARNDEERWQVIRGACREFGFLRAELRLNGNSYGETLTEANGNPTWGIEIPLPEKGCLRLLRCFGAAQAPTVIVPFAEALYRNVGQQASDETEGGRAQVAAE